MNSRPTTANVTASRRRLTTTKRSARSSRPRHRGGDPEARRAGRSTAADRRGPRIRPVIDREQVLHVARLARLELSEEEIERMAGELSGILEHVERIAELDLDGVEPTTHVVELENVLRADEPGRACRASGRSSRRPTPPTAPSASPRPRP